ncbi:hypothetical protein Tco_0273157 [Tanacetum coccineum]
MVSHGDPSTDNDIEEFQLPDESQVVLRIPRKHESLTHQSQTLQPESKISHLKPFGCQVTILNTSDYLGKFEGKADEGYLVGYASNSKAYRVYNLPNKRVEETLNLRFLDITNVQGHWSDGGTLTLTITVSLGPSSSNGPSVMERNADYAESLLSFKEQEYEAKEKMPRYLILILSAGSDPAGGNPADSSQPAGSFEPADKSNPAVSSSVSADFIPVHADASTLPPGQVLGSSENTTRFPVPSDVCKDQISSGIFTSSSYDDDFRATLTNLAPAVEVNPVPTKRVNTIHPQSQILGDLASPVMTRSRAQKSKFGESAFIGYIQDQQRTNHTDIHCLYRLLLSQLDVKLPFFFIWRNEEEVYVTQPKALKFPYFPKNVYRVVLKLCMDFIKHLEPWYCKIVQFYVTQITERDYVKTLVIKKDSRDIIFWSPGLCGWTIIFGSTTLKTGVVTTLRFSLSVGSLRDSDFAGSMGIGNSLQVDVISGQDGSLDSEPVAGLWFQLHEYQNLHRQPEHHMHCEEPSNCGHKICVLVSILGWWNPLREVEGRMVSAGCTMFLLVVILPAGRMVSAGSMAYAADSVYMLVGILLLVDSFLLIGCIPAVCMVSAVGGLFLLAEYIHAAGVVYAANTSIHAAGLVCAGSIMFLLADLFLLVVTCFCCAQLDIAGWLVSALVTLVSAGVSIPAGVTMYLLPDLACCCLTYSVSCLDLSLC